LESEMVVVSLGRGKGDRRIINNVHGGGRGGDRGVETFTPDTGKGLKEEGKGRRSRFLIGQGRKRRQTWEREGKKSQGGLHAAGERGGKKEKKGRKKGRSSFFCFGRKRDGILSRKKKKREEMFQTLVRL